MTTPLTQLTDPKPNGHYPGKPLSLEELENRPYLKSLAEQVRNIIHAHKTLRDIDLQNKQEYAEFIALCRRDLVFYLKVTQQYYLLLNLFKDPKTKAQWAKFIAEIRAAEQEQARKTQEGGAKIIKKETGSLPLSSESQPKPLFDWTHPHPNLSNIEKWQHYEQELQRITVDYHVSKTQIYSHAYDAKQKRMTSILQSSQVSEELKSKIEEIQSRFAGKKQEIMDKPVRNGDGSINIHLVEQQQEGIQQLYQGMAEEFHNVLVEHVAKNEDPVIMALLIEDDAENMNFAQDLAEIDKAFLAQKASLEAHLALSRTAAKEEALVNLDNLIEIIENYPAKELNQGQKDSVNNSINQLRIYQNQLRKTNDFDSVQKILHQCKEEFGIIKNSVPAAAYKEIKPKIELIDKMLVKSLSPEAAQPDQLEKKREQYNRYRNSIQMMPALKIFDSNTPESGQINSILKIISPKIDEILSQNLSPESLKLAQSIKDQIIKIGEYTDYQEVPSELKKSFANSLEELGELHDNLSDFKEKFAPIFEPKENSYQLR